MAFPPELSSLARLVRAITAEGIRFQVIGMVGAILQGVPATTLDTDLWIDLPSRQYMRLVNLSLRLGFRHVSNTVIELDDGSVVNFVYEPNGLRSFASEYRAAKWIRWLDHRVKVLPLERIRASKRAAGRPKDLAHLPLIDMVIRARNTARRRKGSRAEDAEAG